MAESLEVAEVRERLRTDVVFWAEHCATILNEDRSPVKLKARPWQRSFDAALQRQDDAGMPMRAIILKARKLGFSTWVAAKFVHRATQFPHQYAIVAAQDRQTAGVLMDMVTLMVNSLPTFEELGLGFSIKPQVLAQGSTRNGNRFMTLGDRMRPHEASIYETITAGARGKGRGYTPSMLHGSEVAHWEDPDVIPGMLNSVPKRPGTIVVLESTANGFNHFHDRWERAVNGAEDPETGGLYAPLFYGWQDNPFNALPFVSDQARDRFIRTVGDPDGGGDEEEPWLVDEFGVTPEQLYWRRVTMSEECDGKIDIFHQEHPAIPEQAFIGSGFPVFSGILVSKAIKAAEAAHPPVQGFLRASEWRERRTRSGTVRVPLDPVWVAREDAEPADFDVWGSQERLLVWEHPLNAVSQGGVPDHQRKPDGQYIVFVDVAEGVAGTIEERDFSAIQVLDHITRKQVARWQSRVDVHDLPLIAYLVALYYNTAWLAPEKNSMGVGVVDVLQKDMHYPRMYRTHRPGDDQIGDAEGRRIGWETNRRTKPLMEMSFGLALKEGTHGLRDVVTARQLTTYVQDPKNRAKHGAKTGSFDDLLMAFMGAHRVADELRPRADRKRGGSSRAPRDSVTGY
jgi:hypothetical protein